MGVVVYIGDGVPGGWVCLREEKIEFLSVDF